MTIRPWKRLLAALLVAAAGALPVCAQPDAAFCDFLIDAAGMDVRQEVIQVQRYTPDADGQYRAEEPAEVTCALNRITQDASFYIQPKADGVSVTADYLTDLDGDGVYEQLEGREASVWEALLSSSAPASDRQALSAGQTYVLSAQVLLQGSQEEAPDPGGAAGPARSGQRPHLSPVCGQPAVHPRRRDGTGAVLLPAGIRPGDHARGHLPRLPLLRRGGIRPVPGLFAGIDEDTFQPDGPFTRAQLAQILWRLGGSLSASGCSFSDVSRTPGTMTPCPGAIRTGS